jgi:AraC-like DNA-binding protein/quercetin dioxygenase-like cupin family protein
MKPVLEKIDPELGTSFRVRQFNEKRICGHTAWHYHPEYEIVYISNGRGKRHIGQHFSYYEEGDLIFLGPNLPHFGFTCDLKDKHTEVVVQMQEDFLGREFLQKPEMNAVKELLERSRQGISFLGKTKETTGRLLVDLVHLPPFDRMVKLLEIMNQLAQSEEYKLLGAEGLGVEVNAQDEERMSRIYEYVNRRFQEPISLEEIAREVNMTVPAFCRYFKRLTQRTFTGFVNEFRVAHACKLLVEEDFSIAEVGFESGFNNLSHFNKQFKTKIGESPSGYRKKVKRLVG